MTRTSKIISHQLKTERFQLTSLKTYYGDIFPSRRKIAKRRKWLQRAMVPRAPQRMLIVNRSKVCRNRKQSSKSLTHP